MIRLSYCVFHKLTGLYCPGCGGTRAVKSLLHGNVVASFLYHPFVVYSVVAAIFILAHYAVYKVRLRTSDNKSVMTYDFPEWVLWGSLVVIGINFIVKNVALIAFGVDLLKLVNP